MKNEKIMEVFDAVKPDAGLEGRIMDAIESEEQIQKRQQRYVTKKILRNLRNVAAIVLVVLISSVSIYGFGIKNLEEYFFADSDSDSIEDIVNTRQKVRIDDYVITLKEYLVEQDNRQIYMVVEVVKRGGELEVNRAGDTVYSFGEGDRFHFVGDNADMEVQGELREGRLLLYIHADGSASDKELDKIVFLEDKYKEDNDVNSRYYGCYMRHYFTLE